MARKNTDLFYSTYTQILLSDLSELIQDCALGFRKNPGKMPSSDQIREANYNAPKILHLSFNLFRHFLEAQKEINKKLDLFQEQLDLINKVIAKILKDKNAATKLTLEELESELHNLTEQIKVLEDLSQKIATLSVKLHEEIRKLKEDWKNNRTNEINKTIAGLETELNIQFSEMEKAQLLNPTMTKAELLEKLSKIE